MSATLVNDSLPQNLISFFSYFDKMRIEDLLSFDFDTSVIENVLFYRIIVNL